MWKKLADFTGSINGYNVTVRITKLDDSAKPKYSVGIGDVRGDNDDFRPFIRGDIFLMKGKGTYADGSAVNEVTGNTIVRNLLNAAEKCIDDDSKAHYAKIAEEQRLHDLKRKERNSNDTQKRREKIQRAFTKPTTPEST